MKKVNLFLVLLMLGSFSLFANNNHDFKKNNDVIKKQVKQKIVKLLEKAPFEASEDLKANIEFLVTKKGEILVTNVISKNEGIAGYVKTRLNYQKVVDKNIGIKLYKMPLTIKKS